LTALLNRVLEEEIDATEQALHRWIDAIPAGNSPTVLLYPPSSVSLLQCKDQVVLMSWSKGAGREAPGAAPVWLAAANEAPIECRTTDFAGRGKEQL
jgi:hypothetical protein